MQATLGTPGVLTKRSVVQCNIGDKSPVLICALLPETSESLALNLQFDEEDEVTFSVLGPRSVHLTGLYFGSGSGKRERDDDDSYPLCHKFIDKTICILLKFDYVVCYLLHNVACLDLLCYK